MTRYVIRRIELRSAFQFGFVAGFATLLLPGLLAGLLAWWLVVLLRAWVTPLQAAWSIPFVTTGTVVDLLNLNGLVAWLNRLDALGWLLMVIVTTGTATVGGLLNGFAVLISAASYNFIATFSGGVAVDADVVAGPLLASPGQARQSGVVAPAPRCQLRLRGQPAQSWALNAGVTTLGSAAGSQIMLPGLAARHAEIRLEQQGYILYNLGNNQTLVDGRPIAVANLLKPGFVLRLGPHELIFQQI